MLAALILALGTGCIEEAQLGGVGADGGSSDAGCALACGSQCCEEGEVCTSGSCCAPESDEALCARSQPRCGVVSLRDNCGQERTLECPNCCEPDSRSDEAICASHNKTCGLFAVSDGCGGTLTVNCGSCELPWTCDAQTNECVCESESDDALCLDAGRECGSLEAQDQCGRPRSIASCGTCEGDEHCDEASGVCQYCGQESDKEFCERLGAECGPLEGLDSCQRPRSVEDCGTCEEPTPLCRFNTCLNPEGPPNDACGTAEELAFTDTGGGYATTTVQGSTALATNDGTESCAVASQGGDVVYWFTTTTPKRLAFMVDPTETAVLSAYLRKAPCNQAGVELEGACVSAPGSSAVTIETLVNDLPPGTWYLWVDSLPGKEGPFTLSVELIDPQPRPANDECIHAEVLVLEDGMKTIIGDTEWATNGGTGACAAMGGGDVVYSLTLAEPKDVAIQVVQGSSTGYLPAVYVRRDCTGSEEPACAAGSGKMVHLPAAQGTYYIVVDGTSLRGGPFTLDVVATDPQPNRTCAEVAPLSLDANGQAVVFGSTVGAGKEETSSCGGSGSDLVYSLTLFRHSSVDLRLTGLLGFQPVAALRESCGARESEVPNSCVRTGSGGIMASAHLPLVRAGTYYLLVDGYSSSIAEGPFLLEVAVTEVGGLPPNDDCTGAQPLVFDATGRTKVSGNNTIAFADAMGLCGGGGPDVVYSFTTTGSQRLDATLTPLTSGARQVLFLRRECDAAQTERACNEGSPDSPVTLAVGHLVPDTTYYLWVAGAPDGGAFQLDVSLTTAPDPPPNNTCAGAMEVRGFESAPGGVVTVPGSNLNATDDFVGSCSTTSAPLNGPEVVYSFTVQEPSSVSVTVAADNRNPGLRPAFYVLDACPSPGYELVCRQSVNGVAAWTFLSLDPGTYYVVVDGVHGTEGSFTLDVGMGSSGPESCASAHDLVFDANGVATVTADTSFARRDASGMCSQGGPGGDLVWRMVVRDDSKLVVELTQSGSNAVFMRSICDDPISEVACATSTANGFTLQSLRAGTYWIWVRAGGSTAPYGAGPFTLKATLSPRDQAPPAHDTCATAKEVVFGPDGKAIEVGDTTTATPDYNCAAEGSLNGPDLVYKIVLNDPSWLRIVVRRDASSPNYRISYMLRRGDCEDPATEITCWDNIGGAASNVSSSNPPPPGYYGGLQAGTYYVFLDGTFASTGPSAGAFTLEVEHGPAYPDRCEVAERLHFDPLTQVASVTRDSTDAAHDIAGFQCQGPTQAELVGVTANGPDMVFSVNLDRPKKLDAVIDATGSALQPTLMMQAECGNKETQMLCRYNNTAGGSARIIAPALPPGDYFLWLDGFSLTKGKFTLTVTLSDPDRPPEGDTCDAPRALVFDPVTGEAEVKGVATTLAMNDVGASCSVATGPDVYFWFDVPTDGQMLRVVATRTASPTPFTPVIHVRRGCDGLPENEMGCGVATAGVVTMSANPLPRGSYLLVVDGAYGTYGELDLTAKLEPAPCSPGVGGMVGRVATDFPILNPPTVTEYYMAADTSPTGWVYIGGTTVLYRVPKTGGDLEAVHALANLGTAQLGYEMLMDGPNIYTVESKTSGTAGFLHRISSNGGLNWSVQDMATFAAVPGGEFRGAAARDGKIWLITRETTLTATTEIWSVDTSGVPPVAAVVDKTFGANTYTYCTGLAVDASAWFTTCRKGGSGSTYAVLRIDRTTAAVKELTTMVPGSLDRIAIVAVDADRDGLADHLYVHSNNRQLYHICKPHSEAPFADLHTVWGASTASNYGMAYDAGANALWFFEDTEKKLVRIQ